jgi:hypothetical protein
MATPTFCVDKAKVKKVSIKAIPVRTAIKNQGACTIPIIEKTSILLKIPNKVAVR